MRLRSISLSTGRREPSREFIISTDQLARENNLTVQSLLIKVEIAPDIAIIIYILVLIDLFFG